MKIFYVTIFLVCITQLFAIEKNNKLQMDSQHVYKVDLSLGFVNGLGVGFGKVNKFESRTFENIINYHYHECKYFYATGLSYQINTFKNPQREKFFWTINGGFDYVKGEEMFSFNPGGNYDEEIPTYETIFPNIAIGFGYSFNISNARSFRISWDIGMKRTFSNLNFSLYF